jgi:hypothetical protein
MLGMTKSEILKVVNLYIGVSGAISEILATVPTRNSTRTIAISTLTPHEYEGTTREQFISILSSAGPWIQAKILRGVLERFPVGKGRPTRTQELHDQLVDLVRRLEAAAPVLTPTPRITSSVVGRAMTDAETLIRNNGATSGVDRIHTALHGYLLAVCDDAGIHHPSDASTTALFRLLREQHPAFQDVGPRVMLPICQAAVN